MTTDTIKTPFPATAEGECLLLVRLGRLAEHVDDDDVIVLFADERCAGPGSCLLHTGEP